MHSTRAVLVVAGCLIATLCPPAQADPSPSAHDVAKAREVVHRQRKALGVASVRLATAQDRLEGLASGAERLVEAYNGELVQLDQAEQAAEQAKARLTAAEDGVEEARSAVAVIAAQSYGGLDLTKPVMTMIADVGGESGFLHRASILEQMGGERAMILAQMRDAEEVAGILRAQADQAYRDQQEAMEQARAAKAAAERAVADQKRQTKQLTADKEELEDQVDAARTRADRLARERAAAIERARFDSVSAVAGPGSAMGDVAANWALTQLGKPYVWAADGPAGYDCSGLTMRAWGQAGVQIDHWTGTQWTSGPHVPLGELRRGDLLFFGQITSNPGDIHHVGMYIGRGLMVHAPQTGDVVRVASMWRRDLVGATRPR